MGERVQIAPDAELKKSSFVRRKRHGGSTKQVIRGFGITKSRSDMARMGGNFALTKINQTQTKACTPAAVVDTSSLAADKRGALLVMKDRSTPSVRDDTVE